MREISLPEKTFYGLFGIFFLYAILLSAGIILPLLRIELFALILGVCGYLFVSLNNKNAPVLPSWLFWVGLALLVATRVYWYFFSAVPLGYDPGWYKFVFEHPFAEQWTKEVFPLLFTVLGAGASYVFGGAFLVKWGVVLLSIGLGVGLYFLIRKLVSEQAALVFFLLYACSYTMYKLFWFNYIKNLLGIGLLFLGLALLHRKKRFWTILVGGVIGGIHQPALLIFGVTLFVESVYTYFVERKKWQFLFERGIDCLLVVLLTLLFNIDRIPQIIGGGFLGVATSLSPDVGGGTFFSAHTYWNVAYLYLPFAVIGFLTSARKYPAYACAFLLTFSFVLFRLFFHNRFIIYADALLLFFAALGLLTIAAYRPRFGKFTLGIILLLGCLVLATRIPFDNPLISDTEFNSISTLELPGTLMVTDRTYSTWYKGYYSGTLIAPGLFDNNPWNEAQWIAFWSDSNRTQMLSSLEKPLYVHQGERQRQYIASGECFEQVTSNIYRFTC